MWIARSHPKESHVRAWFWALAASLTLLVFYSRPTPAPAYKSASEHEWRIYGGDKGSTRYSALTQINRNNVASLKVAWTFHTGDLKPDTITTMECSPIEVDGVLYLTSPTLIVFALNAANGKEIWRFDPGNKDQKVSRGVTYWEGG